MNSGRIRFEVRGLTTKTSSGYEGGTSYQHVATVVALGDEKITSTPFWVVFSVKRLKGGDPNTPRANQQLTGLFSGPNEASSRVAIVAIDRGVGQLEISGGFRAKAESWEPEEIEIVPVALLPLIPLPVKRDPEGIR